MKRSVFTVLFLLLAHQVSFAAFDKTDLQPCTYQVLCPGGTVVTAYDTYEECIEGWGLCFNGSSCGENTTIGQICAGVPDGNGDPNDCDANPWYPECDPFDYY